MLCSARSYIGVCALDPYDCIKYYKQLDLHKNKINVKLPMLSNPFE